MSTDQGFTTAVERAYLSILSQMEPADEAELSLHQEILEQAIYKADPTHGGLRYKALPEAEELEARLVRALSNHLRRPSDEP